MAMIRGSAFYAKVLGKAPLGYDKTEASREWSIDVGIDAATRKQLIAMGVGDYVKNKGDKHPAKDDFIGFKRRAQKVDGDPAKPIRIVGPDGEPWPQDKLIGNGSIVNIQFALNEKAKGGLKPSILAIQVWEHVAYEGGDREDFPVRDATAAEVWGEDE